MTATTNHTNKCTFLQRTMQKPQQADKGTRQIVMSVQLPESTVWAGHRHNTICTFGAAVSKTCKSDVQKVLLHVLVKNKIPPKQHQCANITLFWSKLIHEIIQHCPEISGVMLFLFSIHILWPIRKVCFKTNTYTCKRAHSQWLISTPSRYWAASTLTLSCAFWNLVI